VSKPVASISVASDKLDDWHTSLPVFKVEVGDLSPEVVRLVTEYKLLDKQGLMQYASKERLTSRQKYLILQLE